MYKISTIRFNDFKKNIYSQNGEDGILQELLNKLNLEKNGRSCESGAWDGKVGSNTFNLFKNFNFKSIGFACLNKNDLDGEIIITNFYNRKDRIVLEKILNEFELTKKLNELGYYFNK